MSFMHSYFFFFFKLGKLEIASLSVFTQHIIVALHIGVHSMILLHNTLEKNNWSNV